MLILKETPHLGTMGGANTGAGRAYLPHHPPSLKLRRDQPDLRVRIRRFRSG